MGGMKTSYSALETFKTCPQKFKYAQSDKLREPKGVQSLFGTIIHSSLKFMYERDPLYPTLDEVINHFTQKWNEKSDAVVWRHPDKKEEEEKLYFNEGLKLLKNFYAKNKPWQDNALELESRFSIELHDEATGVTHTLSGIIDRIDKDPASGIYEIIDYKTGKKMPAEDSLKDNLQLGVYALALGKRWPSAAAIKTSLYFLKHNEKISTMPTKEILAATRDGVLGIIRDIEKRFEKDDFPPTPGPLCGWCGFRAICPMWSHEYKTEEEKKAPDEAELAQVIRDFFVLKARETETKKELAEAREKILAYMREKNLPRVFGGDGSITKTEIARYEYDMEQIKPVLEKTGLWEKILFPDTKLLQEILATLPDSLREEVCALRKEKKTIVLKPLKKNSRGD